MDSVENLVFLLTSAGSVGYECLEFSVKFSLLLEFEKSDNNCVCENGGSVTAGFYRISDIV
ncbi:hypothetical protein DPMN_088982 [Dreissena polymorpha]|uniref:Uncharacterized protein n=1 Tax=Dreissena polymorpha TaxID=45954 RepID=A0A9D4KV37_DREPO|nr:hypothetical protein DPMN_088982 [Dreissena polymorpha]